MKLQINTSGAWRDLVEIEDHDRETVIRALGPLAALAPHAKFCILRGRRSRSWITSAELMHWARWRPVTPEQPEPCQDVMVSILATCDEEPLTYMAFRSRTEPDKWFLSGTDDEPLTGVFAWAPCMPAAPASMKDTSA